MPDGGFVKIVHPLIAHHLAAQWAREMQSREYDLWILSTAFIIRRLDAEMSVAVKWKHSTGHENRGEVETLNFI